MGLGAGESQGLWHLPQGAWGWLLPSWVFGPPTPPLETQPSWCCPTSQSPLWRVAGPTSTPSHTECCDTQNPVGAGAGDTVLCP